MIAVRKVRLAERNIRAAVNTDRVSIMVEIIRTKSAAITLKHPSTNSTKAQNLLVRNMPCSTGKRYVDEVDDLNIVGIGSKATLMGETICATAITPALIVLCDLYLWKQFSSTQSFQYWYTMLLWT